MKIAYPAEKIEAFSKACLGESPIGLQSENEKVTYRAFHRLLLANHGIQSHGAVTVKDYATECVADCSLAYLLFFLNLNKASLASLRSSIENSWRYLLQSNGRSAGDFEFIPDLVSECRSLNLYDGLSTEIVNRGYAIYKDLCQAVHSSKDDYLTNEVPFQNLTALNKEKSNTNLEIARKVFQNDLEVLVISNLNIIKALEAKEFDGVMDGLERTLKRRLHEID